METLLTTNTETLIFKADSESDLSALIELSAHELSLVGGGTANVAFV